MNLNFPSITRRGLIVIDPKPGGVFYVLDMQGLAAIFQVHSFRINNQAL